MAPNLSLERVDPEEKLKKLPSIIKRVVQREDFTGLLIFKSMEIVIENAEAHFNTEEPGSAKKIKRKRTTKQITLRVGLADLAKIYRTEGDLSDLLTDSLKYEDGVGFSLNLKERKDGTFKRSKIFSTQNEFIKLNIPRIKSDVIVRYEEFFFLIQIDFLSLNSTYLN